MTTATTPAASPLATLRVLELGTGVAAPYAGRLLAMLGATVRKLEPAGGDPARRCPIDDRPFSRTSPLFLYLNAGKQTAAISDDALAEELAWADVVIDSRVRAQLAGTTLDPDRLARTHPDLLLASVTAWGFEAAEPGDVRDELLTEAVAGVTTLTGDAGAAPLRLPGWQSQYFAGAYTAAFILASRCAEPGKRPRLVDVAWVSCLPTGVEGSFERYLYTGLVPPPGGAHPPLPFPSGALRCADGAVVPGTVRQHDWEMQTVLYGMPELLTDERFATREARAANYRALWQVVQPWYDRHARHEIFSRARDLGLAMGMVLTAGDALDDEHLAQRGFLGEHDGPDGRFIAPVRPFIIEDAPGAVANARAASRQDERSYDEVSDRRDVRRQDGDEAALPLRGVRVVELTTAWAAPFIGRLLGALGAEVIKVESARYPDLWRGPIAADGSHNRMPNFNAVNRNKQSVALDLAAPDGRAALLRLVSVADVVVSNFTARVLPNLRLEYADLCAARPDVVFLNMPALGASGPYRDAAGYGTIIEGMGGFAARFGYRNEDARVSQTFYADPVAGIHGTIAVLAGLTRRRQTGCGCAIDLSQQEALWLQLGEGIALRSLSGREPERMSNAEPGSSPSGCYPSADGRWLALVVGADEEFARLVRATDGALAAFAAASAAERVRQREAIDAAVSAWCSRLPLAELLSRLEAARLRAKPVNSYREASRAPELRRLDAFEEVDHAEVGRRTYLRVPVRLDGQPLSTRLPAPCLGRDTERVLAAWLGLEQREPESRRAQGFAV